MTIPIKPLSSHEKSGEYPADAKSNKMTIKGTFDVNQMNNWLYNILPDVSVNVMEKEIYYYYYNRITDSHLKVVVTDGQADFESESLVSIGIIKDIISKLAGETSTSIGVDWSVSEDSIRKILTKIESEYNQFKDIEKKYKLIGPIEEISQLETEECKISENYKNILFNRESITEKYNKMPKDVQQYAQIVKDLGKGYLLLKSIRSTEKLKSIENELKLVAESYEHRFSAETFFRLITT